MFTFALTELAALMGALSVLLLVTSGWGILARRLLKLEQQHALGPETLWLGLVFLMGMLAVFHLFHPIDWYTRAIIIAIGLAGIFCTHRIPEQARSMFKTVQSHPVAFCFVIIMISALGLKGLQGPRNFDSALYHFQTIRWLNEFPIIPGLGNLHGRLAFNQSYFNLLALLNIEPIATKGYVAGNLFIFLLAQYSILTNYQQLETSAQTLAFALLIGLGLCLEGVLAPGGLSSPSPDWAVSILQIQMFFYLSTVLMIWKTNRTIHFENVLMVVVLAYFVFTIKISALIFSAVSAAVLIPIIYHATTTQHKTLTKVLAVLFILLALHFARGYLLSGAPLFPSTIGAAWTLPWTMLEESIRGEALWIYSWARQPGGTPDIVLNSWDWFRPWLATQPKVAATLFILFLLAAALDLSLLLWSKPRSRIGLLYLLLLPLFFSLFFWFFTAPDFRFLNTIPVLLVGMMFFLASQRLIVTNWLPRSAANLLRDGLQPKTFYIIAFMLLFYFLGPRSITPRIPQQLPIAKTNLKTTESGVQVFETPDGLCWHSQLPCTPFVIPRLRYVDETKGVKSGFTLR
jgi:hypothetical protein